MPMLLRVEPDQSLTELGEHFGGQAHHLAYTLSSENPGTEYLVDTGSKAEKYLNGRYQGWIVSSTGKRA